MIMGLGLNLGLCLLRNLSRIYEHSTRRQNKCLRHGRNLVHGNYLILLCLHALIQNRRALGTLVGTLPPGLVALLMKLVLTMQGIVLVLVPDNVIRAHGARTIVLQCLDQRIIALGTIRLALDAFLVKDMPARSFLFVGISVNIFRTELALTVALECLHTRSHDESSW